MGGMYSRIGAATSLGYNLCMAGFSTSKLKSTANNSMYLVGALGPASATTDGLLLKQHSPYRDLPPRYITIK